MPPRCLRLLATVLVGGLPSAASTSTAPYEDVERRWSLEIVEHLEHYPIIGTTAQELREQLKDHGPRRGINGHGRTRSEFELVYELQEDAGTCQVGERQIRLVITTTLPYWNSGARSPDKLQDSWAAAEAALIRHEKGHRDHAVDTAHSLRETLSRMQAEGDCKRAWAGIRRSLKMAMWKLDLRAARYDSRTRNGLRDDPAGMQSRNDDGRPKPAVAVP